MLFVIVLLVTILAIFLLGMRREGPRIELSSASETSHPDLSRFDPSLEASTSTSQNSQVARGRKAEDRGASSAGHDNIVLVVLDRRNGIPIEGADLRLDLEQYDTGISPSDRDGIIRIPCSHSVSDSGLLEEDCMAILGQGGIIDAPGYATASFLIQDFATTVLLDHACSILFVAQHEDLTPAADVGLRITMSGLQALQGGGQGILGIRRGGTTSLSMGKGTIKLEVDPLMNKPRVIGGALGQRDIFGTTGQDGSLILDSLTPGVSLLPIVVDGNRSYKLEQVELAPGERRLVEWRRPPGFEITGSVIDANGEILAALEVAVIEGINDVTDNYLLQGDERIFMRTRTASDGSFSFQGVPIGSWYVAPAASLELQRRGMLEFLPACLAQRVVLPEGAGAFVNLTFSEGVYLQGSVRTQAGAPAQGVKVQARPTWCGGGSYAIPRVDGSYILGPVVEGNYTVTIISKHGESLPLEWVADSEAPNSMELVTLE